MNFDVSYGNYDTVAAQAYVSGGLTENLAANFAVQYKNQSDGWGRNVFTGKKEYYSQDFNVRGKIQIGRASGRERVCKYGKISVWAVSLKKKKIIKNTQ